MTCKDCFHYEVCKLTPLEFATAKYYTFCNCAEKCECFKDKSIIMELPIVAMIEQHLVNGKFANSNIQNKNGLYAVVYLDKNKWGSPLIDICGKSAYNTDEAEARLKELQNGNI